MTDELVHQGRNGSTVKTKILLAVFVILAIIIAIESKFNSGESKSTRFSNNACKMLKENPDWYVSLKASEEKWNTPIHIQLGMIRQESAFKHDAKPKRENKWHEFGSNYDSTAKGYSQAINGTWEHYLKSTKGVLKSRSSFRDATDFIGWYNSKSNINNRISLNDPKHLYLAYHEGWTGYRLKTHEKKSFLVRSTSNVVIWSDKYKAQLNNCELTGETDIYFKLSLYADYFVIALGYLVTILGYLLDVVVFLVKAIVFVVSAIYDLVR